MDPVKQKLLADLWVVLRDLVPGLRIATPEDAEAFYASVPKAERNDEGLCYHHLN